MISLIKKITNYNLALPISECDFGIRYLIPDTRYLNPIIVHQHFFIDLIR